MKTKIIPFDLETAKKIQAGEIKGCIKDANGIVGTIVTFNGQNTPLPIVVKFSFPDGDTIFFVGNDGVSTRIYLVLEVPDNEPQKPQFKPFDKVLVRNSDDELWIPRLFEIYSGATEKYYCQDCGGYLQCIPYEGNEHLVSTTKKPKDE